MAATSQPNILFFFPDQWHPEWLGDNPNVPLRTPNLDALTQQGMKFDRCFTPSPLCSPARACLATGRDYKHCQVANNGYNTPLSLPTYYQRLRDAGYRVAGVGKFDLHKADHDQGLDGQNMVQEYGFTEGIDNEGKWDAINPYRKRGNQPTGPYMHYLRGRGLDEVHAQAMEEGRSQHHGAWVTPLPDDAYCDNWVTENGLHFLDRFPKDQPWHLVVNFVGPHEPFDVTADMHEAWKDADLPPANDNDQDDPKVIMARRQHYAAMLENIDRHIGRMIDKVRERGELENTLIVFSSDHGEMLGDHGRWGKSTSYQGAVGIPLIVAGPGVPEGQRSDTIVALHDLAATFLAYAGAPALPDMEARSLQPVFEDTSAKHRPHMVSGLDSWRMAFDGRHKLTVDTQSGLSLFDLQEDPLENENLAGVQRETVARLHAILEAEGALAQAAESRHHAARPATSSNARAVLP